MDALVEFIKILVPASVVLYGAYLLVRMFIQKEVDLKKLEVRGKSIETVLPNRRRLGSKPSPLSVHSKRVFAGSQAGHFQIFAVQMTAGIR